MIRLLAPYLVAAGVGFSSAWFIQGLRLTSAEQDFVDFKQELTLAQIAAEKKQQKRQKETSDAWAKNMDALRAAYRSGWVPKLPSGSGLALRPATRAYAAGEAAVPASSGVEDQCLADFEQLMLDAAELQLQLNALQNDIKAQEK